MARVLIVGEDGHLDRLLSLSPPPGLELATAHFEPGTNIERDEINRMIEDADPEWVINALSYPDADEAEEEEELAYRINCDAARFIAEACEERGSMLIHLSTYLVFDGEKEGPYIPSDEADPLSIHGRSKREGEHVAQKVLPERTIIIRPGWLYSEYGDNFATKMLRMMTDHEELRVTEDQFGSPTYAGGLARAISRLIELELRQPATYHWCDEGVATWYQFATELQHQALTLKLLEHEIPIKEIPASEYPGLAQRPRNGALDTSRLAETLRIAPTAWREQLRQMVERLATSEETRV